MSADTLQSTDKMTTRPEPSGRAADSNMNHRGQRVALILGLACVAAASCFWHRSAPLRWPSDFSLAWAGMRAFADGLDPYTFVGPGRPHDFTHQLLYPFTALIAAAPFTLLPIRVADPLFIGLGVGLMTWALTRRGVWSPALLAIPSFGLLWVILAVQWTPALIGAVFLPWLGFLLVCKPTMGAALWFAYPSWKSAVSALILIAVSFLVWPSWVTHWLPTMTDTAHLVPPVMRWGGPLLLLAALRWRTSEGRLLLAMSCLPLNPAPNEALPLFLIPKTWAEGLTLAVGLFLTPIISGGWPQSSVLEGYYQRSQVITICCYLPCLWMVLRRGHLPSIRVWTAYISRRVSRSS
jgi:hypothetical protein